jgi:hypothetical protein
MPKRIIIVLIILVLAAGIFFLGKKVLVREDTASDKKKPNLDHLKALPYISHTENKADASKSRVTIYEKGKFFDGYNLVEGELIDMEGNVIKKMPGFAINIIDENGDIYCRRNSTLQRFDWQLNKIWDSVKIHHDIFLTSRNTILTASKEIREYHGRKVEFDVILEFDKDGSEVGRWSAWKNFDKLRRFHRPLPLDEPGKMDTRTVPIKTGKEKEFGGDFDYYHLNTIQELSQNPLGQSDDRFQEGNWLIVLRNVNLVAILDKDTRDIVWSYGIDELDQPHHARMLENGHITLFDNGPYRGYTRVIELDPVSQKIVWEYKADPPESFQSKWLGSVQRLPNGNTLVGDGWNGRAFEVTPEGSVVWEWYKPDFNEKGQRKNFYQIIRYDREKIDKLLESEANRRP